MSRTERADRSPQARLRREHERTIFRMITAHAAISRTQLAEQIGLSGQSVGRMVRDLLEMGLIEETDIERSSGPGASPVGLRVRSDGAYAIGFGLERDCLTAVALDLGGNIVWQEILALSKGVTASTTLCKIDRCVKGLLDSPEWSGRKDRLSGVGLGAPGPIELTTGALLGAPNFPSWEHVDVLDELEALLGLPVVIDNAATAAAIGVAWQMPRSRSSFLYCYWGMGIGGGLVLGDESYRGTTGNAIELGHVVVNPTGHPCDCGSNGCLETEASAAALLRDAAPYGNFTSVREIVAAAEDSRAVRNLLTRAGNYLAMTLLSIANVLDVDEVVLGGNHFHEIEELFLPVIREQVENHTFRRRIAPVKVSVTGLGEIANAIGAAALVFDSNVPAGMGRQPVSPRAIDTWAARSRLIPPPNKGNTP